MGREEALHGPLITQIKLGACGEQQIVIAERAAAPLERRADEATVAGDIEGGIAVHGGG